MPLFVPQHSSTYSDATSTRGGELSTYIHAQFRDDADLDWLERVKAKLGRLDEVKSKDIETDLHLIQGDRDLWERFQKGIGQASIIIVEPQRVADEIKDVATRDAEDEKHARQLLLSSCATALIQQTPIAYLPIELTKLAGVSAVTVAALYDFSPEELTKQFGQYLKHAKIFAARAHATFDVENRPKSISTTRDVFNSPLARVLLAELLATERVFDVEHPASVNVINKAAQRIAATLENAPIETIVGTLAREDDSRARAQTQAADLAAGWARTVVEHNRQPEKLAEQFQRVIVNGKFID